MTGGILGSSFYDPGVKVPHHGQTGYARLPDGANQMLINDTIYLDDPAFILPRRSHVRRRKFQDLQNKYYRQILYGCTNPRCETPTCLSRQKKVSKGPFRPYTVLSARALATFLASEDHPEKGLCPHQQAILPAVSGSPPSRNDANLANKVRRKPENLSHSLASGPVRYSLPTNKDKPEVFIPSTTHVGNGHVKCASPGKRAAKPPNAAKTSETDLNGNRGHVEKDTKSFAQCLFDTAAMKCLQLARGPYEYFSGLTSTSQEPTTESHGDGCSPDAHVSSNLAGQCVGSMGPQANSSSSSEKLNNTLNVNPLERPAARFDLSFRGPDSDGDSTRQLSSMNTEVQQTSRNGRCKSPGNVVETHAYPKKITLRAPIKSRDNMSAKEEMKAKSPSQYSLEVTSQENGNDVLQPQSLSHFTADNIQALIDTIKDQHSDLFEEHRRWRMRGRTDTPIRVSTCSHDEAESYQNCLAYSAQSITYVLGDPEALMQSFLHCETDERTSRKVVSSYALPLMVHSLRQLRGLSFHPWSMMPPLWISAGYIYPKKFPPKGLLTAEDSIFRCNYDLGASHIIKVIFAALIAWIPECHGRAWDILSKLRAHGQVALPADGSMVDPKLMKTILNVGAAFENEMALGVATRLIKAIAARHAHSKSSKYVEYHGLNYIVCVVKYMKHANLKVRVTESEDLLPSIKGIDTNVKEVLKFSEGLERPFKVMIEWLRSIIMKEWDGKPQIRKDSAVGCALELLRQIRIACSWFAAEPEIFYTPFLSERLDVMEMPPEWIESAEDDALVHLLSFHFLFTPSVLVSYFRAINYAAMHEAFEKADMAQYLVRRMSFTDPRTGRGAIRLRDRLRIAQSQYLVLEVRRDDILTDAMDQLWRRQTRELMRPLRVEIGMTEGEEGQDHGGVQQEFFRIAIAEAMDPKYGAFTTDSTTQMSWFQPASLEPLYKFELIGLLTSLAVYNGLTLPFTFPCALYRLLLGLPVEKLEHIEDGWPELAKGLRILRDWPEDNVEDVFMRPYVFSVNCFGTTVDVDMEKARETLIRRVQRARQMDEESGKVSPPKKAGSQEDHKEDSASDNEGIMTDSANSKESATSGEKAEPNTRSSYVDYSSSEDEAFHGRNKYDHSKLPHTKPHRRGSEPIMVTNANRHQYIREYISTLIHISVGPQFKAFCTGFFTCIKPKSLSLFTPTALKALIEGLPNISIPQLETITKYDGGYHSAHPTIRQFWRVVRSWPQEKVRQLLEFVTSSDRLPVGGAGRLVFIVQKNGVGDDRLPTSSTCFGRLLLPEFSSEERLRRGLEIAVEHSKGFGMA